MNNLSHKEKANLLMELEELYEIQESRRRSRAIEYYEPHKKQGIFHDGYKKKYSFFIGANQVGKTTAGVCDDIADALGYEPWSGRKRKDPPLNILICGEDYPNHVNDVIIPKLYEYLPEDLIAKVEKIQGKYISKIFLKNGSVFKFMTYEQESSKFEGSTIDVVHWDEPNPREHYIAALRGIIRRGGRMKWTMTAIKEPWIKEKIIDMTPPEQMVLTHVHLDENPYLPQDMKDLFIASLDPDEKKARVEGDWLHLGGQIYKGFDKEIHVVDNEKVIEKVIDENLPCGVCVDPHDRKPFMMAWFAVTQENEIIFFYEWPNHELFHNIKQCEYGMPDYINLIKEIEENLGISQNVLWRYIDPNSGNARKATVTEGESFVDLFAGEGLYFDHEIKDNISYGHKKVKEFLKDRKLFFSDNLRSIPFAMQNYAWADFKRSAMGIKEVPQEKYKDPCDCVRYTVVKEPEYIEFNSPLVGAHDSWRGALG